MSAAAIGVTRHCAEHEIQWDGLEGCWVCGAPGEPGRLPDAGIDGGMTWRNGDHAWRPAGRGR